MQTVHECFVLLQALKLEAVPRGGYTPLMLLLRCLPPPTLLLSPPHAHPHHPHLSLSLPPRTLQASPFLLASKRPPRRIKQGLSDPVIPFIKSMRLLVVASALLAQVAQGFFFYPMTSPPVLSRRSSDAIAPPTYGRRAAMAPLASTRKQKTLAEELDDLRVRSSVQDGWRVACCVAYPVLLRAHPTPYPCSWTSPP